MFMIRASPRDFPVKIAERYIPLYNLSRAAGLA
jgi:hypothetical protein